MSITQKKKPTLVSYMALPFVWLEPAAMEKNRLFDIAFQCAWVFNRLAVRNILMSNTLASVFFQCDLSPKLNYLSTNSKIILVSYKKGWNSILSQKSSEENLYFIKADINFIFTSNKAKPYVQQIFNTFFWPLTATKKGLKSFWKFERGSASHKVFSLYIYMNKWVAA